MIKEIFFTNFRNLKDRKITLSKGFNLIYGQNAQGKTSFMEAIYFACTGRSFRTKKLNELIKYEKDDSKVYVKLFNTDSYAIDLSKLEKRFFQNSTRIKYSDYIGNILSISFIPEDVELVMGNPSIRRTFFNYEISQINKEYLHLIMKYEKVLKIRNRLIKEKKVNTDIYSIYNDKYIECIVEIIKCRSEYILEINKIIDKKYKELFNQSNSLSIRYENFMKINDFENLKEKVTKFLKEKEIYDLNSGFSNYGIHKDEYIFNLNDKNARFYSSQGEKKSIVFVLKISELELMEEKYSKKAIFLMDDITSFFDNFRKNQIINYFLEKEIQVFLTATEDLKILGKKFDLIKGEIKDYDEY